MHKVQGTISHWRDTVTYNPEGEDDTHPQIHVLELVQNIVK